MTKVQRARLDYEIACFRLRTEGPSQKAKEHASLTHAVDLAHCALVDAICDARAAVLP